MRYLLILILLVACSSRSDTPPVTPPVTPPAIEVTINKTLTLDELIKERVKLKSQLVTLETVIENKQKEQVLFWSRLIAWISLSVAGVTFILSFVLIKYPALPFVTRLVSYMSGAVAILAFAVPTLYPLLVPVSILAVALFLSFGLLSWWKDRKSLVQVIIGVNELKTSVPNYKEILRNNIDEKSDKWINNIRERLDK